MTTARAEAYTGKHRSASRKPDEAPRIFTYVGKHRDDTDVCDFCGDPVLEPVRDPAAVAWLGEGAQVFCSSVCMESQSEHAINADGNAS